LSEYIPIDDVLGDAVGRFLCWPRYDEDIARQRLSQLKELRIESLALGGRHSIQGHHVLGKGHVGVVLKAIKGGKEVALKIRRTDADRESMHREAEMLILVNEAGVGPTLHGVSNDFIVMEKITGPYLGEWINGFRGNPEELRNVIRALLEKSRKLDHAGVDHGELTKVKRHFIVTEVGPKIIDFESASTERRMQNVTATAQSLFLNKGFASQLGPHLTLPDPEALIEALSTYKQNQTDYNFKKILEVCNLIQG
jgi:putative serine/threonine protein kinase